MMPEAPTRVPATIRRLLSSTKPEAATARPVNEFSNEIRTGTSAPPMGNTKAAEHERQRQEDEDKDDVSGKQRHHNESSDGHAHQRVNDLLAGSR